MRIFSASVLIINNDVFSDNVLISDIENLTNIILYIQTYFNLQSLNELKYNKEGTYDMLPPENDRVKLTRKNY